MRLLLLFHRLPYPPNKGEKIRYFHFLKHLAERHELRVGCFVDPSDSPAEIEAARGMAREFKAVPITGLDRRLAYGRGFATGKALSLAPFDSAELQGWVDDVLRKTNIDCTLACSAAMGGFIANAQGRAGRFVMDFVDMDSDKWDQYSTTSPWPLSALYRREARLTLAAERSLAVRADASLFVSSTEVDDFLQRVPEAAGKVHAVENGVDAEYYDPARDYRTPYGPDEIAPIVFVGTMDYLPNIDAVAWFARQVMPLILRRKPQATFHIVGTRPSREVARLDGLPGIRVTGAVPDVRPYLAWARVSVAPLRIARGIQNKVLEAMAMARPVVVTPSALAGVDAKPERDVFLGTTEAELAEQVLAAFDDARAHEIGRAARRFVLGNFLWRTKLDQLEQFLGSGGPTP